mgnify:CR=1 FL=1
MNRLGIACVVIAACAHRGAEPSVKVPIDSPPKPVTWTAVRAENCLLTCRDGREHLVLLDFGLAKVCGEPLLSLAPSSAPGALIGTFAYISPEQARDEPITTAADIYSVGVILFELVTRRPPFPGTNALQLLSAHASTPPPSARELAPERPISDKLDALLQGALAKHPADRPADARAFAIELTHELAALDPDAREDLRPRHPATRATRHLIHRLRRRSRCRPGSLGDEGRRGRCRHRRVRVRALARALWLHAGRAARRRGWQQH